MRVALVTTSYPRHEHDIAGTFVAGFAHALVDRGHSVRVFAAESERVVQERVVEGLEVTRIPYLRPRAWQRTFYGAGVPDNARRTPLAWPGLATYPFALGLALGPRLHGFDAVVSHFGVPSGLIGSGVSRGRPHLAVFHSADVHLLSRMPLGRTIARAIVRGASALWFVSHDHARRFERTLGRPIACRVHVGPMGFTPARSTEDRAEQRVRHGVQSFVVLAVARLVPVKGLATAIEAIAAVPDAELVVAGDGPERAALEALARRVGARVRFLGAVDAIERDRWLLMADAFVHASTTLASGRSEGAPVAILEASHARLPIVATDVGGVRELVTDGVDGLLVPDHEPLAMARALRRLRADHAFARSLGENARRRAEPLAWQAMGASIEALLGDTIRAGARAQG